MSESAAGGMRINDDLTRIIELEGPLRDMFLHTPPRPPARPRPLWKPRVALLLSAVPGLGHLYRGATWSGLAWLTAAIIAYAASWPLGLGIHLLGACRATCGDPYGL
ncbi:MAG: hypothetical protein KDA21_01575 [Phycisphaerales bacterium]|nr:hypothetical protein [Phycisphaerales bacterium]